MRNGASPMSADGSEMTTLTGSTATAGLNGSTAIVRATATAAAKRNARTSVRRATGRRGRPRRPVARRTLVRAFRLAAAVAVALTMAVLPFKPAVAVDPVSVVISLPSADMGDAPFLIAQARGYF